MSRLSKLGVLPVILAFLLMLPALAQDEGEDDGEARTAVLSLYLRPDGNLHVNFYSSVAINRMEELTQGLSKTLQCSLSAFRSPDYSYSARDAQQAEQIRQARKKAAQHQFTAVCPAAVKHQQMQSTLAFGVGPMLAALGEAHVEYLTVSFVDNQLPNLHAAEGSVVPTGSSRFGMLSFLIPVTASKSDIQLVWGYQPSDLRLPLIAAAAFVVLPSVVIVWMRFRALSLHTTDRAGAWFSYIRTQNLCLTGALLIWIGGGFSTRTLFTSILSAAWGMTSARVAIASLAYIFVPPMAVLMVSILSSYRVMVEVRQVQWSFGDFLKLQAAQVGIIMFPMLGIYAGIQLMGSFTWIALATIVLSILFLPFAVQLRRRLTGGYPEPVTSGEFHDRIFLLARRAGVTLKSIFVLPSGKLPVANAFAAGNGVVMVTDYILQKLNRREVEAVAAHEIGHLQYKHPKKLGMAFMSVILVPFLLTTLLPIFSETALVFLPAGVRPRLFGSSTTFSPILDFVVAGICLVIFYAISRRFERIADARSVTLTDDPEALITAFAKLSVVNLTPMQWGRASGALVTHPSTMRRVRRIAEIGGVSEERLQQLLSEPTLAETNSEQVELFPSPLPASARIDPAYRQLQRAQINLLLLVGISTAIPTLFAYLAATHPVYELAILLFGVVATFSSYLAAVRWRIVDGRNKLRAKFIEHFAKLYPVLDLSQARLVGYSPEAWPRFHYVQSHWDTGLLIPVREGLLYLGDQMKLMLPYSSIQEVIYERGTPGWWKFNRSYIRWNEGRGVMNFVSLEPCSPWAIERGNQELHRALEGWRAAKDSLPSLPAECGSLSLPTPVQLKSKSPREAYPLSSATKLVLPALIAAVFVFNATLSVWSLLYIPGVVFLLRYLESLPYRRYKDRPLSSASAPSSAPVEKEASTQSAN